jgi:hypothetical protein
MEDALYVIPFRHICTFENHTTDIFRLYGAGG